MSVKLRFKRMGRSNKAFFRLNAMDSRSPRDGRAIEELGYYDPRSKGTTPSSLWSISSAVAGGSITERSRPALYRQCSSAAASNTNTLNYQPGKPKPVPVVAKKKEDKTAAAPAAEAPK